MMQLNAMVEERRSRGKKRKVPAEAEDGSNNVVRRLQAAEPGAASSSRGNDDSRQGPITISGLRSATGGVVGVAQGPEDQSQGEGTVTLPNVSILSEPSPSPNCSLSHVVPSIHAQLGEAVSQTLKAKIVAGDYVDLALLFDSKFEDGTKTLTVNSAGEIIFKPASNNLNSKISSIESWTDAFIIYASIYSAAHPERHQELLKYMSTIRTAAKRCKSLGWKLYDQQFRHRIAMDPSRTWSAIDYELWLLFITTPMAHEGQPQISAKNVMILI